MEIKLKQIGKPCGCEQPPGKVCNKFKLAIQVRTKDYIAFKKDQETSFTKNIPYVPFLHAPGVIASSSFVYLSIKGQTTKLRLYLLYPIPT